MKHKGIDYKTSAVQYYLNNNESMDKVCKIFNCKKTTLKVWIHNYENNKNLTRCNRKPISYKITNLQVKYALELLKNNEQITMFELRKLILKKYSNFKITSQHLGEVIRDSNRTRKRTKHQHFPLTRYKITLNKK